MTQHMKDAPDAGSGSVAPDSMRATSSGVGTQLLRSLAGAGADVQMKSLAPRDAVQKKAVIGPGYGPAKATNKKVEKVIGDDTKRRFKSQGELDTFADTKKAEDAGEMSDGTWVRLDELNVLGEDHGARAAPEIIKGTGTRRFRYEAFSHHSATRKGKSQGLTDELAKQGNDKLSKLAGRDAPEEGEQSHEAEHALPKYARIVPDVKGIADAQVAGKQFGKSDVAAGTALAAEYSVVQALLDGFLTALLYAQSYEKKFFSHKVKAWYAANKKAADDTIKAMQKEPGKVPDLATIRGSLPDLTTAYRDEALAKLDMKKPGQVEAFKNKLVKGVDDQATTEEAKENDYLRDASMLQTIKQAKGAGDKLFIIGDAHRQKLQTLVSGLGIKSMRDTEFVEQQKAMNADTERGITATDRGIKADSAAKAASGAYLPDPPPVWTTDSFVLPSLASLASCEWEVLGATPGDGGKYTCDGSPRVYLHIRWKKGGVDDQIFRKQYDLKTKASRNKTPVKKPSADKPKALSSASPSASSASAPIESTPKDHKSVTPDTKGEPTGDT